jgi:Ala-tRNA(Pro) deacylase
VTGEALIGAGSVAGDLYTRLIADLDGAGAQYRLIEHAPEAQTEAVSLLRGHDLDRSARGHRERHRPADQLPL